MRAPMTMQASRIASWTKIILTIVGFARTAANRTLVRCPPSAGGFVHR